MRESTENSLYHFKSKKEYLISILEDFSFKPRYNTETVILKKVDGSKVLNINIPMICWTDVPLERIGIHTTRYGCYGIGVTKIWALKNLVNPVIYLIQDTGLANSLHNLVEIILEIGEELENDSNLKKRIARFTGPLFHAHNMLSQYIKPYSFQGLNNIQEERKFYDEKEWRYIPEAQFPNINLNIPTNISKDELESINSKLSDFKLKFSHEDLDAIIISNNSEKEEIEGVILKSLKTRNEEDKFEEIISKIIILDNCNYGK